MEYFKDRFIDELNAEGEVEIRGIVWPREEVLHSVDRDAYRQVFDDWLGETKDAAKERAGDFLTANSCLERFRRLNERVRTGSVMPWIGAGMSMPSRFPGWEKFLRHLAEEDPALVDEIDCLLNDGRYENAAQLVVDGLSQNILDENIENVFGVPPEAPLGPVCLLPGIFRVGVVTTNFDYTLDRVYELSELPFGRSFAGRDLSFAPLQAAEERHCLFRIHGEANNPDGRILTHSDYQREYSEESPLRDVLCGLIATRSLLFMGCSLSIDRPLMALAELRAQANVQRPRHYAFLPMPEAGLRAGRRMQLEEAEIHPIWYPNDGEHDQHIEDLLICLIEGGLDV